MSLMVGKTFCKGKRVTYSHMKNPTACMRCVFGKGPHTCEKKDPKRAA